MYVCKTYAGMLACMFEYNNVKVFSADNQVAPIFLVHFKIQFSIHS